MRELTEKVDHIFAVVRNYFLSPLHKDFFIFGLTTAPTIPPLDIRSQSRDNMDEKPGDFEGPKTMRNVSGRFHHIHPRQATNATRLVMVWLSYFFNWRPALRIVKPATFTGWHRQGFRVFWRWKSKPGRPALPKDLQALIRRMALENPTWGQERIANALLLKLGLKVSPRTVRKYMPGH